MNEKAPANPMDHFLTLAVDAVNSHNAALAAQARIEALEKDVAALRSELAASQESYHTCNDILKAVRYDRDRLRDDCETLRRLLYGSKPTSNS